MGHSTFEVGIQQCQIRTINFFITFYLMITCVITTVINKAHLIVATFGLHLLQLPQLMAKLKKKISSPKIENEEEISSSLNMKLTKKIL